MKNSDRLKELREENGFSPEELASRHGVNVAGIEAWESGSLMMPADKLAATAECYGLRPGEIDATKSDATDFIATGQAAYDPFLLGTDYRFGFQIHSDISLLLLGIWLLVSAILSLVHVRVPDFWMITILIMTAVIVWHILIVLIRNHRLEKTWKDGQNGLVRYRFYSDRMEIMTASPSIRYYCDIKKVYQNTDFIFVSFGSAVYPIAKNSFGSEEKKIVFDLIGLKKDVKTSSAVRVLLKILFILTLFALILALIARSIAVARSPLPHFGRTAQELNWIFWLFLPLPALSILIGFIYRHRGARGLKDIVSGLIVGSLLFTIGKTYLDADVSHDMSYVDILNLRLPFTLPTEGYISCLYDPDPKTIAYAMIKFDSPSAILEMIESDPQWKNQPIIKFQVIQYSYRRQIGNFDFFYLYSFDSDEIGGRGIYYYLAYDVSDNVFFCLNFKY